MIRKIKSLPKFVMYCKEITLMSMEESQEIESEWIQATISYNRPKKDLLEDMVAALTIYYYWINISNEAETYEYSEIINKCIKIEIDHYSRLFDVLYNDSMYSEIKRINEFMIEKYIINGKKN